MSLLAQFEGGNLRAVWDGIPFFAVPMGIWGYVAELGMQFVRSYLWQQPRDPIFGEVSVQ